jgi:hypothetical protein
MFVFVCKKKKKSQGENIFFCRIILTHYFSKLTPESDSIGTTYPTYNSQEPQYSTEWEVMANQLNMYKIM